LIVSGGAALPTTGDAAGRQLGVRIALDGGRTLVLQGVGENAITACQGRIDGSLSGPADGDLGDWHAIATGGSAQNASGASGGSTQAALAAVATETSAAGATTASPPSPTPALLASTTPTMPPLTTTCTPLTTAQVCSPRICGLWDDGCGGQVDCAFPCESFERCYLGACCEPRHPSVNCPGKCGRVVGTCGEPVECGSCLEGYTCSIERCCGNPGTFCQVNADCCSGSCSMLNGCA
jgi:hypothetical protein